MRMSQEEKERSHGRIVEGAARLLRVHGIEGTSVADVMAQAGMTIGGFYKHFDSKDALVSAALRSAFETVPARVDGELVATEPARALAEYRALYLSMDHVRSPGIGCPVATLSGDVGRAPPELKVAFGAGVRRIVERIAGCLRGSEARRRAKATREFAMMVGAVMIARASDPDTARDVLAACRPAANSDNRPRTVST